MGFLDFIAKPLGQFLYFIYNNLAFHNYGLAIIIFVIFIRLLILPLTLKQYRTSARMQEIQPQIQELQQRYKNDKQQLNIELMKFYQENKVNPAGGCLPLLIQLPILISMWQVIAKPLTYMLGWDSAKISAKIAELHITGKSYKELAIIMNDKAEHLLNMNFLGMNLGNVPKLDFNKMAHNPQYIGLFMLPLIATALTFISSKMMMPKKVQSNSKNKNAQVPNQMAGMQSAMLYIAPAMTLIFSFQFPAGLSVYWIAGYIIQIIQQFYINKHILYKNKEVKS